MIIFALKLQTDKDVLFDNQKWTTGDETDMVYCSRSMSEFCPQQYGQLIQKISIIQPCSSESHVGRAYQAIHDKSGLAAVQLNQFSF